MKKTLLIIVTFLLSSVPLFAHAYSTVGTSLNTGLVGYWTFDGSSLVTNVTDTSGQGNSGNLSGFAATSSSIMAGKVGQALKFNNNKSQLVNITNGVPFDFSGASNFTISAWINPSAVTGGTVSAVIFSHMPTAGGSGYDFAVSSSDVLTFTGTDGTGAMTVNGTKAVPINKWSYVSVVFTSSTQVSFYLNGALDSTQNLSRSFASGATRALIAHNDNASATYYQGLIDDVRVYNRALSVTEIQRLYTISATPYTLNTSQTLKGSSLNQGLVGYWTFDGNNLIKNAADSSTQGNNGDLVSFPATSTAVVSGKVGQALSFNGSDNVTAGQVFASAPSAVSWGGWINYKNSIVSHVGLIGQSNGGASQGFFMYGESAQGVGCFINSTEEKAVNFLKANTWFHVFCVWDGSNLFIYVNGVQKGSIAVSSITNSSNSFQMGTGPGAGSFNGSLDDIRVYNRALSVSEIKQLYNNTANAYTPNTSVPFKGSSLTNGLVGYWTFDGKDTNWTTGITNDLSGQGNTGQMLGMSTTTSAVPGKIGQALSFNGLITNLVDVPGISNPTTAYTISAWVKRSIVNENSRGILTKGIAANEFGISGGGNNNASCSNPNVSTPISNAGSVPVGRWTFVACVWTGTQLTFYVNAASSTSILSSTAPSGTTDFFIGKAQNNSNWIGQIDDARVYNRALSPAELTQLYQDRAYAYTLK